MDWAERVFDRVADAVFGRARSVERTASVAVLVVVLFAFILARVLASKGSGVVGAAQGIRGGIAQSKVLELMGPGYECVPQTVGFFGDPSVAPVDCSWKDARYEAKVRFWGGVSQEVSVRPIYPSIGPWETLTQY